MNSIISVENLGKKYRIGTKAPYKTLRETLMNALASPARMFRKNSSSSLNLKPNTLNLTPDSSQSADTFWALKDVSFEVNQGEVVGIIGRNGAGKTTLLKILSRVTEPTEGMIKLRGRVASLLEVGTGFHPELTGRENIYLNGVILGMRKHEIKKKFDEIVVFSEIEKFLDTPVKRYSSGMYVRLAFAVAAHLEPEILVVDEVLAVGDAQFQKKCLGKMGEVAKEGRTVLFVSHNMTAVSNLCSRLILLNKGVVDFIGDVAGGIDRYLSSRFQGEKIDFNDLSYHDGALAFSRFSNVEALNEKDEPAREFRIGDCFKLKMEFTLSEGIPHLELGFCIHNLMGARLSHFFGEWEGLPTRFSEGRHTVVCEVPNIYCLPGIYGITPWMKRKGGGVDDQVDFASEITVIGHDINGFNPDFERYPNLGVYQKSIWKIEA